MTTTMIRSELVKRFEESGWKKIDITMKSDGRRITIKPCSYDDTITSEEQVDYFLTHDNIVYGGDTLDNVAEQILNYDKLKQDMEDSKRELHEYYVAYNDTDEMDWGYYSDWHKDVYGYRPRHGEH